MQHGRSKPARWRARVVFFAAILCLTGLTVPAWADTGDDRKTTADHTKFEVLQVKFSFGPDVTKACLSCHTEAARQIQKTTHWTWDYEHPDTGQKLGKRNVINSFCGSPMSNEAVCTSCHIGYGWKNLKTDLSEQDRVDCLVCHDTTGTYRKAYGKAGHPLYEGEDAPDLTRIAKAVGPTSRRSCGSCHFYGGGGDGVKHGDLDSSLSEPDEFLDIHMDAEGLNFTCSTCHNPKGHAVPGSRYRVTAKDEEGIDAPGKEYKSHASCESCHGTVPHINKAKLNDHTDKVACQTCHIPAFARGMIATKTWWDWSTAGRLDKDGKPMVIMGDDGHPEYSSIKGDFRYEEDVVPTYRWFDGQVRYTLWTDKLDDSQQPIPVNDIVGSYDDPKSRIWPFKVMRGKQIYDTENKTLLVNHLFSNEDDTAFWTNFDWDKAVKAGADYAGQPFSGKYGFTETVMYWPITHMVPPKDEALACDSCHAKDSRLNGLPGFYVPSRDNLPLLDLLGYAFVALCVLGVLGHTALRIFFCFRRNRCDAA